MLRWSYIVRNILPEIHVITYVTKDRVVTKQLNCLLEDFPTRAHGSHDSVPRD